MRTDLSASNRVRASAARRTPRCGRRWWGRQRWTPPSRACGRGRRPLQGEIRIRKIKIGKKYVGNWSFNLQSRKLRFSSLTALRLGGRRVLACRHRRSRLVGLFQNANNDWAQKLIYTCEITIPVPSPCRTPWPSCARPARPPWRRGRCRPPGQCWRSACRPRGLDLGNSWRNWTVGEYLKCLGLWRFKVKGALGQLGTENTIL